MSIADHDPTDRQRKLIDILRIQVSLTPDEMDDLARSHGSASMQDITRKVASAIITDLQRIKQEKWDRGVDDMWRNLR